MKLALIGYGKMGKIIEETAKAREHKTNLIIDVDNKDQLTRENLGKVDVAIEFTVPDAAFDNINACFDAGIPVVCGTTGWLDRLDPVRERCLREGKALIYASNFSLGVNILFHLNRILARIMNRFPEYEVSLKEIHHIMKKDAPSGTAITLAGDIIAALDRKNDWTLSAEPKDRDIGINAIRADQIFGIHELAYESEFDKLSIRHSAKDRRGFAAGIVLAAEFIRGKTGFFTMKDVLSL